MSIRHGYQKDVLDTGLLVWGEVFMAKDTDMPEAMAQFNVKKVAPQGSLSGKSCGRTETTHREQPV